MTDVTQARRPAHLQPGPVHDAGVQLHPALGVQTGADARVEKWLVFHVAHRTTGGRQAAIGERRPPDLSSPLDRGLTLSTFGFGDGPGAAVDDQGRAGQRWAVWLVGQGLGPAAPALNEAAVRDPPVEGVEDAPVCGGALRAAALAEAPVDARSPVAISPFRTALNHLHHSLRARVMLSHSLVDCGQLFVDPPL